MQRGRTLPRLLAAAATCVAVAAAVPLYSIAGPSTLPACGAADLVPRFAKLVVTQGPTSYTRAARGKEAVVRAHLTIPTTCLVARTQSITPTSATLTVTGGSASGPIANYNALSGALGSAVLADSTADPLFIVPAAALRPGDGSTTSAVSVAVAVTYTRLNSGVTTTNTTPAGAAGSTKTLTLDRKGNALRVLLVPMGDPASTAVQWDAAANASAQALMSAAARVFPVQDGWGTLASGQTGGVRFSINQGLLDVRSLNLYRTASGLTKFCSSGSNFSISQVTTGAFAGLTLKGQLQQTLADYNARNPTALASLALGVIKDDFAWPTNNTAGLVCDDGRAATPVAGAPGAVGWVRLSTVSTYPTPGLMEIAHNVGVVRQVAGVNTSYHSLNVEADVGAPDQGYNVIHRKVLRAGGTLGNDHSVMNYNFSTVPYTTDNILAEPDQWNDLQCDLRPPSASDPVTCGTIATSVGSSDGVAAASDIFGIDGTYDATTGVVRVTNSRLIAQADPDAVADPASVLKLRFLNGASCASPGAQLGAEFGVPILGDDGHTEGHGDEHTGPPSGFHVNVPFPAGATVVQLRIGADVKYCRAAQPGNVPDVTGVTGVTPPGTGTLLRSFPLPQPQGGTQVNGRAIAFDGHDLWATFGPNSSNAMDGKIYKVSTTGTLLRTENLFTPIGALAYDRQQGKLYGGHYDLAPKKPDQSGTVYEITTGASPTATRLFRYPFTGGTTCATPNPKAVNGLEDIPGGFVISADLAKKAYITTRTGADISSFSTVAAGADCNTGIARDNDGLWLASLATAGSTTMVHVSETGAPDGLKFTVPDYRAEDIEFDDVTFAPKCALWMNQATSTVPQVRAYQVPCESAGGSFTFSANAPDLVGTAYFNCGRPGDPFYPIASSLRDTDLTDTISTFTFTFYELHSCGEGTPKIFVTASNGIYESPLTDINASFPVAPASKPPSAEIVAPFDGATFRVGTTIPFYGTGLDPEDGALTGTALTWFLDGVPLAQTGTSFDRIAPSPGTHVVTLRATDAQGHVSETSVTFIVAADTSAPQVSLTLPAPNGNPPWNTTLPVVQLNIADGDGLASFVCFEDSTLLSFKQFVPAVASYSEQLHPSIDGIEQLSCTATDSAGNQTTVNDFIYIDTTAPLLNPTVTPNPVVLGGTATASANASDAVSGVASQSCGPVVTNEVGTFTVTCTATDVAGNTSSSTATYSVVFSTGICNGEPSHAILQPINADGSSVFRQRSTVAVKFRVCDAAGLAISAADVVIPPSPSTHPADCTVPLPTPTPTTRAPVLCTRVPTSSGNVNEAVDSTTPDTNFRWNGSGTQWIFNLGTKNLSSGIVYGYYIPLKDGTIIRFTFALK